MNEQDVHRTIDMIKELCDARGHEVLDAIGDTLIEAIRAVDQLNRLFEMHRDVNVVPMRPEDFLADNERWSRKAGA